MNAPRLWPAAAHAAAAAIGAMLVGCSAPTTKRFSETEPLRTADIVNAPQYEAAPATPSLQPVPPQAASAATAARAPDVAPRAQPAAAAPVTEAAPRPPAPAIATAKRAAPASLEPLAPGRWAVQVGVFAVAANAERDRARVAARLAATDIAAGQRIVRVERIGDRSHVLVGDLPNRDAALALAAQLRRALNQDVVVLRR